MEKHAYVLDVSSLVGERYVAFVEDVARTVTIQVAVQLLMSAVGGDELFSGRFWLILLYVVLGTAGYHLLLRALVDIR